MRNPIPSFFIVHPSLTFGRRPSFFIFHCSLFIILSFFIAGCTKSTSPNTGSLSGRVILVNDTGDPSLDPVDFSGVTVALYELAVLDTTIVRINQEYPQIGVQISQETEFDHRNYNPISLVQSDAAGNFQFSKVPHGTYNLLAFKEGWGYKYIYRVVIDKDVNSISIDKDNKQVFTRNNDLLLYPARLLPSYIDYPLTLREGRIYIANHNTNVFSQVVVEPNAKLLIAANTKIDFHNSVSTPTDGSTWLISTSDGVYTTEHTADIASFDQVGFFAQEPLTFHGMIFEQSLNGLRFNAPQTTLTNSIVRNNQNHAILFNGASGLFQESILMGNPQKAISAFNAFNLIKAIVYENRDACFLSETTSMITNSYFSDNYIGVRPFYGSISIENNCFDRNDYAISPSASNPLIRRNNFYANFCDVELNGYYTHQNVAVCNPVIENNNFFGNGWYIHLRGRNSVYADGEYQYNGVNQNQVYPNNYLKALDLVSHIFDSNNPNANNFPHAVSLNPRSSTPNPTAGI